MKASIKYLAIFSNKNKYSIVHMCKFFGVSKSGYYDFVKKINVPAKDKYIASLISECQEKSNKTYGCRRVKIWLEKQKHIFLNRTSNQNRLFNAIPNIRIRNRNNEKCNRYKKSKK